MTCNRDCSKCIYGIPRKTYRCNSPNTTCDNDCSNCRSASDESVEWFCIARIFNSKELLDSLDNFILHGSNRKNF